MPENVLRWIELRPAENPPRRLLVKTDIPSIVVPVRAADGYGQVHYSFSGLHADDGCEIWTPQSWIKH